MIEYNNSLKKNKHKSKNYDFNHKKTLLDKNYINKDFLYKLKFLSIEDILYLKLNSSLEGVNGKLFNFPLYKSMANITKHACLLYALSASSTLKEAAMILGISKSELSRLIKLYKLEESSLNDS